MATWGRGRDSLLGSMTFELLMDEQEFARRGRASWKREQLLQRQSRIWPGCF